MIIPDNRLLIEINEDFQIYNREAVSNMIDLCKIVKSPKHLMEVYKSNKISWHFGEPNSNDYGINMAEIYYPDDIILTKRGDCFENSLLFREFALLTNIQKSSIAFLASANLAGSITLVGHAFPIFKGKTNKYYAWAYLHDYTGCICGPYSSFKDASLGFGHYYIKIATNRFQDRNYTGPDYFFAYLNELYDLPIIDRVLHNKNRTLTQNDIVTSLPSIRKMYDEIKEKYKFYHPDSLSESKKSQEKIPFIFTSLNKQQVKKLIKEIEKDGKLVYKV